MEEGKRDVKGRFEDFLKKVGRWLERGWRKIGRKLE